MPLKRPFLLGRKTYKKAGLCAEYLVSLRPTNKASAPGAKQATERFAQQWLGALVISGMSRARLLSPDKK